jgi:hypothetical protein
MTRVKFVSAESRKWVLNEGTHDVVCTVMYNSIVTILPRNMEIMNYERESAALSTLHVNGRQQEGQVFCDVIAF